MSCTPSQVCPESEMKKLVTNTGFLIEEQKYSYQIAIINKAIPVK